MSVHIAGAGPAGCAAALLLARAGVRLTLWTGGGLPRPGTSETLHPGTAELLRTLGAESALADAHRSWAGWEVRRHVFDARLRALAAQAGASLCAERHPGQVEADGWLLDATGRRRMLARRLNLSERTDGPPLVAWRGAVSGYHQADGERFSPEPGGWSWIAPEPDGRCTWTRVGSSEVPGRLAGCPELAPARGFDVRRSMVRPCAGPGWMLLGDAAATVEPATGQGVLTALWSGIAAARTVLAMREQPALRELWLARYDDAVVRRWEGECAALGRGTGRERRGNDELGQASPPD